MVRRIRQILLICLLVCLMIWHSVSASFSLMGISPPEDRVPLNYSYGYSAGNHFQFTDNITETLDIQTDFLVEEEVHTIGVGIEAIDEDVEYYSIRITARVTNLSAGIDTYNSTYYMEGYSPIVAGPRVYFTHTDWNIHYSDWLTSANEYQEFNQLSGSVSQNLETRYFYWNLTKYVDNSTSIYDIDLDGVADAYFIINSYTAQFDEDGVLQLRSFYAAKKFDCGAIYTRLRTIKLESEPSNASLFIYTSFTIIIIITTAALLSISAILLIRLYPRKHEHESAT
jgi:hypothetical protein